MPQQKHGAKFGEGARYARHRAELGLRGGEIAVSKKLLSRDLDAAIGPDGTIDFELADKLWEATTDPNPKNPGGLSKTGGAAKGPWRREKPEDTPKASLDALEGVPVFAARKLAAETGLKELELAQKRDLLVEELRVRRLWGNILTSVASSLEGLPTELAQTLSEQSDPKRCEAILRKRLDEIRSQLPQEFEFSAKQVALEEAE